ncbi:MAG: beta-lactamase family protein [Acetatifactor sp.]|nr:beta-lactamase family protein [Acetatifactor sp.]
MTGGGNPFYEKIGFEACIGWTFWEKDFSHGKKTDIENKLRQDFRGAEIVVSEGEILFRRVTGYADLANRIPNTLETKFASASAGKVFVAVGILQLIEQGKLRFEDTLGNLLELDLHGIDPEVTVEQLLTHTSGVPDYFDESVMEEYEELWVDYPNYKIRRNADLLPLFIHKEMMYPRGERFQYNNTGYVLLAMILEKVTGKAFDVYLRQHVFEACGMRDTGYYELDRLPAGCASNYIYDAAYGSYRTNIYSVDAKGTGAGGAFITLPDIVRFWEGLASGKLLSPDMVSRMLRRQSGDGLDSEEGYYGYGVWIIDGGDCDIPYFQGCDPGVSFLSEYHPRKKTITVLVSNYGDNVWEEMRRIRDTLYP